MDMHEAITIWDGSPGLKNKWLDHAQKLLDEGYPLPLRAQMHMQDHQNLNQGDAVRVSAKVLFMDAACKHDITDPSELARMSCTNSQLYVN